MDSTEPTESISASFLQRLRVASASFNLELTLLELKVGAPLQDSDQLKSSASTRRLQRVFLSREEVPLTSPGELKLALKALVYLPKHELEDIQSALHRRIFSGSYVVGFSRNNSWNTKEESGLELQVVLPKIPTSEKLTHTLFIIETAFNLGGEHFSLWRAAVLANSSGSNRKIAKSPMGYRIAAIYDGPIYSGTGPRNHITLAEALKSFL